jgi:hypothetical protein
MGQSVNRLIADAPVLAVQMARARQLEGSNALNHFAILIDFASSARVDRQQSFGRSA